MSAMLKRQLWALWFWLLYGGTYRVSIAMDGGCVSEFAVRSHRTDAVVGYWAYGAWCKTYHYRGQDLC